MAADDYFTFHDALTHLVDYERANASNSRERFHRRAIFSAIQVLSHSHHWSYLYRIGRVNTSAPHSDGTIEYDHTGGAYERMVTGTGTSFPSWSFAGTLLIGEVRYEVSNWINPTTLQLSVHSNPGEDLAAGTSYTLLRDRYLLPQDLWTIDDLQTPESWRDMSYVHPRDWVRYSRYSTSSANTPAIYSVIGSEDFQGCMDLILQPYPDRATPIDFVYSRRIKTIKVQDHKLGTVTTSGNSKVVTGDSSAFTDMLVGAIIRVADDNSEYPTGMDGANPYSEQRMVMKVNSATELEVDFDFTTSRSGVKYVISDPIDIEYGVMKTAFLRCMENQLAKMARLGGPQGMQIAEAEWKMELIKAKEADDRTTAMRAVGKRPYRQRLADMPTGADIT